MGSEDASRKTTSRADAGLRSALRDTPARTINHAATRAIHLSLRWRLSQSAFGLRHRSTSECSGEAADIGTDDGDAKLA